MRTIKIIFIGLLAILLCSCKHTDYFGTPTTYRIDNTNLSLGSYVIYVESPRAALLMDIPAGTFMPRHSETTWFTTTSFSNYFPCTYQDLCTVSIVLDGGLRYTYTGDMIENDIRDINSWTKEIVELDPGTKFIYTYTFTDEDYERIMELCEQPPM